MNTRTTNGATSHSTTILAIDGAASTGYAIYHNGKITKHGTRVFRASPHESKSHKYGAWLQSVIAKYHITAIVAEDTFRKHGNEYEQRKYDNTAKGLNKLQGVLEYISEENGITPVLTAPIDWKRKILPTSFGKRTRELDKRKMLVLAQKLGYQLEKPTADDEADAIGIMLHYLECNKLPVIHPVNE